MLLAAKTLGDNTITIKPNIKYKEVVKKLATANLIATATCDFTDTGSVTLTERIIEPKPLQVNLVLCKDDFRSDWEAVSMGFSAFDTLPSTFANYLIDNIGKSIGANLETKIWQSTVDFSGFTNLFVADATVVDVSGTTITASNVQAELAKVVAAAAALNTFNQGEKPVIYAGTSIMYNYMISLGGFGAAGLGGSGYKAEGPTGVQNAPLFFGGLQLVETPGLPANQMVVAQPSNLWFGTGLMSDMNKVQVLDMADLDGSENVRFIARFTAGVQYGIGSEIVYYWIY
jgi:hypothetical protein